MSSLGSLKHKIKKLSWRKCVSRHVIFGTNPFLCDFKLPLEQFEIGIEANAVGQYISEL